MRAKSKVIMTCAITGSIHTPSMSPYLPVTANDIATRAVEAARRGPPFYIFMRVIRWTGGQRARLTSTMNFCHASSRPAMR